MNEVRARAAFAQFSAWGTARGANRTEILRASDFLSY
jgi:hypothetical protein